MSTPERAETMSGPVGLEADDVWPRYEHDPSLRRAADEALIEVTGLATVPSAGQSEDAVEPRAADLVLTVTCLPSVHPARRPPALGSVYATSHGFLFVAALPGRWDAETQDWSQDASSADPDTGSPLEAGSEAIPTTLVRLLLERGDPPERVPVKCRSCSTAHVWTAELRRAARAVNPSRKRRARSQWVPLDRVG